MNIKTSGQGLRIIIALLAAMLVTFASLYLMQQLISQQASIDPNGKRYKQIDFVRLREESEVEVRQRRLPEKPKPLQKPKPSTSQSIANSESLTPDQISFDVPSATIPGGVASGPQLSGLLKHMGTVSADRSIMPLVRVQPQYPRRAAMRGIEGEVLMSFTITPIGTVKDVKIIDSKPKGIFDRAAKRAILSWKFKPKVVSGKAVNQQAEQKLIFKLNRS